MAGEQLIPLRSQYRDNGVRPKKGGHHTDRTGKNRPKLKDPNTPPHNPRILIVDGLTGHRSWGERMKDLPKT